MTVLTTASKKFTIHTYLRIRSFYLTFFNIILKNSHKIKLITYISDATVNVFRAI